MSKTDILKDAQERGENKLVVGATGVGKTTDVESLMHLINRGGHPGCQTSLAGSGMERLAAISVSDCAEIAISIKS